MKQGPNGQSRRRAVLVSLAVAGILASLLLLVLSVCGQPPPRYVNAPPGPAWLALAGVILGLAGTIALALSAGRQQGPAGRSVNPLFAMTLSVLTVFLLSVIAIMLSGVFYFSYKDVRDVVSEQRLVGVEFVPASQPGSQPATGPAPKIAREIYGNPFLDALKLSVLTSVATLVIVLLVAVPTGYALSRYRFPGAALMNALADLPMVIPPLIIGVLLLVFFRAPLGRWISDSGLEFVFSVKGIILCQFFCSASYGIRACKAAFDDVDTGLENLALTLGCTRLGAFWRVVLPQARSGLVAGGIIAWAHAVGLFAPLQVFAGAVPFKTAVLPTAIYLETSNGKIERAVAISMIMLAFSAVALVLVHWLLPARKGRAA
ncbi:MAG: ABC transporter permease [Phycisphaerae bacterium]